MLDDSPTVEQARGGCERAWRTLYERHADLVFRLALRVVKDRDAALDIVQESFVRASRSIDSFRGDSSFRAWLVSITLNQSRSWVRDRTRKAEVSFDVLPEPPEVRRADDDRVADRDLAARAMAFARTLPEQQREAVLLRTTSDLSYKEIARVLHTSEGSVRVSYHHGMTRVRAYMESLLTR